MNLSAASGRGIMMDYLLNFSPQAVGNLPKLIKMISVNLKSIADCLN